MGQEEAVGSHLHMQRAAGNSGTSALPETMNDVMACFGENITSFLFCHYYHYPTAISNMFITAMNILVKEN